jgi:hypothetical protein
MEYLGPTFIVFAILLVVTIAAFSFEPANPLDAWFKLAERYQTGRRPSAIEFSDQSLLFGIKRVRRLNDFARFDVTIDEFGLWIVYRNNDQDDVPSALKIPGTHVRFRGQHGQRYVFELYAEPPVRMAVRGNLGAALMQQCSA